MRLPRGGREYCHLPVTTDPPGLAVEVTFDETTWYSTEADPDHAEHVRFLVAHPDATSNPDGTIVLTSGRRVPTIRATDSPEIAIRTSTGAIYVD